MNEKEFSFSTKRFQAGKISIPKWSETSILFGKELMTDSKTLLVLFSSPYSNTVNPVDIVLSIVDYLTLECTLNERSFMSRSKSTSPVS